MGFLFQIETPGEGKAEPAIEEEAQLLNGSLAQTGGANFWAVFLPKVPVAISGQTDALESPTTAKGAIPSVAVDECETPEQQSAEAEGFELSTNEWTILPTAIPIPIHIPSPPDGATGLSEPTDPRPAASGPPLNAQIQASSKASAFPDGPTAIEATFQLQSPSTVSTEQKSSIPALREATSAASKPPLSDLGPMEPEPEGPEGQADLDDARKDILSAEIEDRGESDTAGGDSSERQPENQDNAPPGEQSNSAERSVPSAPTHPYTRVNGASNPSWPNSSERFLQAIEEAGNTSIPDKRASPLQFQLRISPEDFGSPKVGGGGEVRLNLLQRGDEIVMRVQGGGEALALRGESEWGTLVDRLKPHGLEATSKVFSGELGTPEREQWTPPIPEKTMPDSAANHGEEQRRFGQEQQQQQHQKQHRHRVPPGFNTNKRPFSLDDDFAGPLSTQGASS